MYDNPWTFNGEVFDDQHIGDAVGFVYLIHDSWSRQYYIGKKIFFNKKTRPPLKGQKKRRISKVSSDWKDYYGSSDELKSRVEAATTKDRFVRQILHICRSKSEMSYLETKEIFGRDVLYDPKYINDWVTCKVSRRQLGLKFS